MAVVASYMFLITYFAARRRYLIGVALLGLGPAVAAVVYMYFCR